MLNFCSNIVCMSFWASFKVSSAIETLFPDGEVCSSGTAPRNHCAMKAHNSNLYTQCLRSKAMATIITVLAMTHPRIQPTSYQSQGATERSLCTLWLKIFWSYTSPKKCLNETQYSSSNLLFEFTPKHKFAELQQTHQFFCFTCSVVTSANYESTE